MNLIRVKRPRYSMQDLQDEMNRILEDAFGDIGIVESNAGKTMNWRPAIELYEENGNYKVKAELPGVKKENIDIEIGEESIEIKAETEKSEERKEENTYKSEFRYGKFVRTIPLPSKIDNSKAKAEFNDGILTVTIPKSQEEQQKTRKLEIGS